MAESLPRSDGWLYLTLPYQIAYGTLSSVVILYILDLHGTVIDASYAITVSNILWIAASLFWGRLIDTYNRRRIFVALSLVGLVGSLLSLYAFRSVLAVIASYGVLSFMITANNTPINLLVMETNTKERWAEGFSKLQMFMSLGGMLGFVLVTLLSGFFSLGVILLLLVPFAVAALLMTGMIKEPARPMAERSLLGSMHAFTSRLLTSHLFFVRKPTLSGFKALAKRLEDAGTPRLPAQTNLNVLYLAALAFFISGTLFNTAYPAGLRFKGFDNFQVLAVLLVGIIIQTVAFHNSGALAERRVKPRLAASSLAVRGVGYAFIGVVFLAAGAIVNFAGGIIIYPIASGTSYALFYTAFNTMLFEALGDEKRGRKLGVYSGIAGLGSLVGALLAGYVSFYIGYWFSFALAGALALLAGYLVLNAAKAKPAAA